MASSKYQVKCLNKAIAYGISSDIFDLDDIYRAFKRMYPNSVPTKRGVERLLKNSKVKAIKDNGQYIRVSGGL